MNYVLLSTIGAAAMAILVLFVRIKASKKPASVKKIILPPIFMSTGALMYLFPEFRLTHSEIIEAILIGAFFSIFLIKTSKFEIQGDDIYLKRSKAFVFILVGLVIIRIVMKMFLSATIEVGQLGGMFFLLAYSMIIPWRVAMFANYKKLHQQLQNINVV
jgi:membrane protein CcdC involved in cytochrome C biogenesis